MSTLNQTDGSRKARYRISLLLLVVLVVGKLWLPSQRSGGQTTAQASGSSANNRPGFEPVGDENKRFWGMAGSLLGIFSGTPLTSEEKQEEAERKAAIERDNQQRWGREYEERRQEERDQKEQDWAESDRRKQAEQEQYDRQRQAQDEQARQRQQEYYDNRQREQGF